MRWRFQFRLKWLLVFVAVLAAPLSWIGWKLEEKRRADWAEGELEKFHVILYYPDNGGGGPAGPKWLRRFLGEEFFMHVTTVECRTPDFARGVNVGPPIDDAGLCYLRYLPTLQHLGIVNSQVTDAGLVHLRVLKGLAVLDLRGTEVSDTAVADLQKALPKCQILRESIP